MIDVSDTPPEPPDDEVPPTSGEIDAAPESTALDTVALVDELPRRREPWDQMQDETDSAYDTFRAYRDLGRGHRSLKRLATARGQDATVVARWSAQHQWVARCQAFDRALDTIEDVEYAMERTRYARDVARVASQVNVAATKVLKLGLTTLEEFIDGDNTRIRTITETRFDRVDGQDVPRIHVYDVVDHVTLDAALKAMTAASSLVSTANGIVGDKVAKVEITGRDGGPIELGHGLSLVDLATAYLSLASGQVLDVPITPSTLDVGSGTTPLDSPYAPVPIGPAPAAPDKDREP